LAELTDVVERGLADGGYLFIEFEVTVEDEAKVACRFGGGKGGAVEMYGGR
jgi:hypothetical protein